ncbi:hypothetical protein [Myxococcus sp. RHSTA-1-4]|uniref:hypothetical protein n=1 Tax=Myxococcus sp. RHSTA-1-4 TaxID=2874601 RepID=UPI001CBDA05F|nr:hypothetical protein [Myxococcus sp. RHSTA-1-4]MBZ4421602.1 hypothetical protein [Myxococcus sp. RHSTA-1-4]
MVRFKGKRVLMIQGGCELPFARPMVEDPCPPGEHAERIYFPEVDPAEANPLRRIAKMRDAENDAFEIAAAEYNVKRGHITHGRQISRAATSAELAAGLNGGHQHVKAVCIRCGQSREIDHAADKRTTVECKNQMSPYGGSDQLKNNKTMLERGMRVSYKLPAGQRGDRRLQTLTDAGFELIFIKFV